MVWSWREQYRLATQRPTMYTSLQETFWDSRCTGKSLTAWTISAGNWFSKCGACNSGAPPRIAESSCDIIRELLLRWQMDWSGSQAGWRREGNFLWNLYDLQWCRSVLLTVLFKWARSENQVFEAEDCDGKLHLIDYYALCTAAKKDQENLKCFLRDLKANHACSADRCDG